MIDNIDEHPFPESRALIREILRRDWDPLPGSPENEYDRYIDNIYTLVVHKHASQGQISAHLLDIRSRRMCLKVTEAAVERCSRAAQFLIAARGNLSIGRIFG
jgi:hypothetical protein